MCVTRPVGDPWQPPVISRLLWLPVVCMEDTNFSEVVAAIIDTGRELPNVSRQQTCFANVHPLLKIIINEIIIFYKICHNYRKQYR